MQAALQYSKFANIHRELPRMTRWLGVAAALLLTCAGPAAAQELVHFPSLDAGKTVLDGYLFRAPGDGRHPAAVLLHGCGGMISRRTGDIDLRLRDWATALNRAGYAALIVDSFTPRGVKNTCAPSTFDKNVNARRPKDAYAALFYLQGQPFVRADRIALIGWSAGGGIVLDTIPRASPGRPAALPQGDFRAAVAFYPARCAANRRPAGWTTRIPLLVLVGAADVWTPAAPCKAFLDTVAGRGAPIEMQIYPGAYHDFDAPNLPRRELPQFTTAEGVVPITATDPVARQDAFARVPGFLARYLGD
jgi:dienelactone hydrolase